MMPSRVSLYEVSHCYLLIMFVVHFVLWKLGFQHSDPSLSNLMVRANDKVVVNDWDLATDPSHDRDQLQKLERTGTLPFMAIDLLTSRYWGPTRSSKPIARLYRHDLESFVWILVFVMHRYEDGHLVAPRGGKRPLDEWLGAHYQLVYAKKRSRLDDWVINKEEPDLPASWESLWRGHALPALPWGAPF